MHKGQKVWPSLSSHTATDRAEDTILFYTGPRTGRYPQDHRQETAGYRKGLWELFLTLAWKSFRRDPWGHEEMPGFPRGKETEWAASRQSCVAGEYPGHSVPAPKTLSPQSALRSYKEDCAKRSCKPRHPLTLPDLALNCRLGQSLAAPALRPPCSSPSTHRILHSSASTPPAPERLCRETRRRAWG